MASIKGYSRSVAVSTVPGAAAATPIDGVGAALNAEDELIAVLQVPSDGGLATVTDLVAEASITAPGQITLTTTDTTGTTLIVLFQQLQV